MCEFREVYVRRSTFDLSTPRLFTMLELVLLFGGQGAVRGAREVGEVGEQPSPLDWSVLSTCVAVVTLGGMIAADCNCKIIHGFIKLNPRTHGIGHCFRRSQAHRMGGAKGTGGMVGEGRGGRSGAVMMPLWDRPKNFMCP